MIVLKLLKLHCVRVVFVLNWNLHCFMEEALNVYPINNCHLAAFSRMDKKARLLLGQQKEFVYLESIQVTGAPGPNFIAKEPRKHMTSLILNGYRENHNMPIKCFWQMKHWECLVDDDVWQEFELLCSMHRYDLKIKRHIWLGPRIVIDIMLHEYSNEEYNRDSMYTLFQL